MQKLYTKTRASRDYFSSDYTSSEKEESKEINNSNKCFGSQELLQNQCYNFSFNELFQNELILNKISVSNENIEQQNLCKSEQNDNNCHLFKSQIRIISSKEDIIHSNSYEQTEEEKKSNKCTFFLSDYCIPSQKDIPSNKKLSERLLLEMLFSDSIETSLDKEYNKSIHYPQQDNIEQSEDKIQEKKQIQKRITNITSLEHIVNIQEQENRQEQDSNLQQQRQILFSIQNNDGIDSNSQSIDIPHLQNNQIFEDSLGQSDEVNTNLSYYSFNAAISEWKENNWKNIDTQSEIKIQDQNNSNEKTESFFSKSIVNKGLQWLKSSVSLYKNKLFHRKGFISDKDLDSDKSYHSFTNLKRRISRRKRNGEVECQSNSESDNYIQNISNDSYFYEIQSRRDLLRQNNSNEQFFLQESSETGDENIQSDKNFNSLENQHSPSLVIHDQILCYGLSSFEMIKLKNLIEGSDFNQAIQASNTITLNRNNYKIFSQSQQNQVTQRNKQIKRYVPRQQLFFLPVLYESLPIYSLQFQIMSRIQNIAVQNDIPFTEMIKLWKKQGYNNSFIENYKQSMLIPNKLNEQQKLKENTDFCRICLTSNIKESHEQFSFKCNHEFCIECFQNHFQSSFQNGKRLYEIFCPSEGCKEQADLFDLQILLHEDQINFLLKQVVYEYIQQNKEYSVCPSPDCISIQKLIISQKTKENNEALIEDHIFTHRNIFCSDCNIEYCNLCKEASHLPLTCSQQEQLINQQALFNETWILMNTKKCPKCFCNIEKNSGCLHMTCSQCNNQFCWGCLQSYTNNSHLGCTDNISELKKENKLHLLLNSENSSFAYNVAMYQLYLESASQTKKQQAQYIKQFQARTENYSSLSDLCFDYFLQFEQVLEMIFQAKKFNCNLYQLYQFIDKNVDPNLQKLQSELQQNISLIEELITNTNNNILDNILNQSNQLLPLICNIIEENKIILKELIIRVLKLNLPSITHSQLYNMPIEILTQSLN